MQAENFHGKEWFKADEQAHGYEGLLDVEPHDLVSEYHRVFQEVRSYQRGSNLEYDS